MNTDSMGNPLVTFEALQNLCDLYKLEVWENRYNQLGDTGFTVIMRVGKQVKRSASVPQDMTTAEAVEWIKGFYESNQPDQR